MAWPFPSRSGVFPPARRDPFYLRAARLLRRFFFVCVALGIGAGGYLCVRTVIRFLGSDYFKIRRVVVRGASDPLEKEARDWLAAQFARHGDNLCRLNKEFLAGGLGNLARARSASVRKVYPQTLEIDFQERQAHMIVNLDKFYLIDDEGILVALARPEMAGRRGLPILTGIRGSLYHVGDRLEQPRLAEVLNAAAFIRHNDPALNERIVEWNLGARGYITAILDSRAEVRFGDQDPLDLLDKLSAALAKDKDLAKASYIDLRMERQIVYK
jgi:cell division septal protein FtsQ